jgi:hypothetical protein
MSEYTPDKWLMVKLTNITEDERSYYFEGSSGSVYNCNKSWYGSSGYGAGVLGDLIEKSKDTLEMEILPEETNFMELNYE